jgi:hypothetical protein
VLATHVRAVHNQEVAQRRRLDEADERIAALVASTAPDPTRAGACVECELRGGELHRCRDCRAGVHIFCARVWTVPDDGLRCPRCREAEEKRLQTKHELPFLDAYLVVHSWHRKKVAADGLCFFRCVATLLDLSLDSVASRLLRYLATELDVDKFGPAGQRAKSQAARSLDLDLLARRWDRDLMDFVPPCVFGVYGRPLLVYELRDRCVHLEWIPHAEAKHPHPLRVTRTGTAAGRDHYDVVIEAKVSQPDKAQRRSERWI